MTARALALALLVALAAPAVADAAKPKRCPVSKHGISQCRYGKHGTPDLSRQEWRARAGKEVTISVRLDGLAPNLAAAGARSWPMLDSLGQQLGTVEHDGDRRFTLHDLRGGSYRATVVNVRGRGCMASAEQQSRFTLLQVIALKAPASGTQGFVDTAALDRSSASGESAFAAFARQRGGGTGCGPSGRERGALRGLKSPGVGRHAHARLSNGELNSVTEYDAKPAFGNVVYFSSNTTAVFVGGVARGMVRVGTRVAKVDQITGCDPSSDGTLTWRYWSIRTGVAARPRMFGWIPARCGGS